MMATSVEEAYANQGFTNANGIAPAYYL